MQKSYDFLNAYKKRLLPLPGLERNLISARILSHKSDDSGYFTEVEDSGKEFNEFPESECVYDPEQNEEIARLEAVLFLSREPIPSRKLSQLAYLEDGTRTRTLVRELNRRYDSQMYAFKVFEVAGGFQLRTRPQFVPWLTRLQDVPVEVRLSGPALETLSIVAFKQPVLRAEIEAVRGVQCGEILRQLMDQDMVRIAGRSEELGRPFLYGTTRKFLQVFGLNRLEDLHENKEQ